jgi:hypothetical protein
MGELVHTAEVWRRLVFPVFALVANLLRRGCISAGHEVLTRSYQTWLQGLYEKQGRSSHFGTKKERDDWIGKEVKELERTIVMKQSSHTQLEAQTQELSSQLMDLSQVCLSQCNCLTSA